LIRIKSFVPIVILALGLLGTVKSSLFLLLIKTAVDAFAIGQGGAKVKLVLLYFLALALTSRLPILWSRRWDRVLPIGLVGLHFVSLAEHVYYCRLTGLAVVARTVCFFDGLYSASRLQHAHASKAVLSTLVGQAGQSFDAGLPFVEIFPTWWLWCHSVLFSVVAMVGFAAAHKAQKERPFGPFLCYALVVFTLLKNSLDGGPLDSQTIAAIPYFVALSGYERGKGLGLAGGLLAVTLSLSGMEFAGYDLWRLFSALIFFAIPLVGQWAWDRPGLKAWLAVLALVCPLLLGPALLYRGHFRTPRLPNSAATLHYGLEKLEKGWTVSLVSQGPLGEVPVELGRIKDVRRGHRVVLSRLQLERDTTPIELCDTFSLNLFRRPVVWYQSPTYAVIEGPMPLPGSESWKESEFVTGFLRDETEGSHRLVLELAVGSGVNVAADALGRESYAAEFFGLLYEKPDPLKSWSNTEP